MKLLRYAYAILLCLVVAVLMINFDAFNHKWMMFIVILVGMLLGYVIEHYLKMKFPETFPKSEKEKQADQLVKDIEEGAVKETIKLPRTIFGTLCEIVAVGIIGYALYRAWTLDQRTWPVIILSVTSLLALYSSYTTEIKKDDYDPKHVGAYKALGDRGHVTAILAALFALLLTYFTDPETTYYKWRPLYLCGCVFIAVRIPIQHFLYKRSAALMAKVNNYDPAGTRVVRTLEGTAYETVAVLMLIGAWCAAALKHQLSGCGILDIPLADLIVCTVFSIGALVLAYFPTWMIDASTFKNDGQVLTSIRQYRLTAVITALFALVLPFVISDLDERTVGYLYVAVLIIISIGNYFFKTFRQESLVNNKEGYETEQQ